MWRQRARAGSPRLPPSGTMCAYVERGGDDAPPRARAATRLTGESWDASRLGASHGGAGPAERGTRHSPHTRGPRRAAPEPPRRSWQATPRAGKTLGAASIFRFLRAYGTPSEPAAPDAQRSTTCSSPAPSSGRHRPLPAATCGKTRSNERAEPTLVCPLGAAAAYSASCATARISYRDALSEGDPDREVDVPAGEGNGAGGARRRALPRLRPTRWPGGGKDGDRGDSSPTRRCARCSPRRSNRPNTAWCWRATAMGWPSRSDPMRAALGAALRAPARRSPRSSPRCTRLARRFPTPLHLDDDTPEQLAAIARQEALSRYGLAFSTGGDRPRRPYREAHRGDPHPIAIFAPLVEYAMNKLASRTSRPRRRPRRPPPPPSLLAPSPRRRFRSRRTRHRRRTPRAAPRPRRAVSERLRAKAASPAAVAAADERPTCSRALSIDGVHAARRRPGRRAQAAIAALGDGLAAARARLDALRRGWRSMAAGGPPACLDGATRLLLALGAKAPTPTPSLPRLHGADHHHGRAQRRDHQSHGAASGAGESAAVAPRRRRDMVEQRRAAGRPQATPRVAACEADRDAPRRAPRVGVGSEANDAATSAAVLVGDKAGPSGLAAAAPGLVPDAGGGGGSSSPRADRRRGRLALRRPTRGNATASGRRRRREVAASNSARRRRGAPPTTPRNRSAAAMVPGGRGTGDLRDGGGRLGVGHALAGGRWARSAEADRVGARASALHAADGSPGACHEAQVEAPLSGEGAARAARAVHRGAACSDPGRAANKVSTASISASWSDVPRSHVGPPRDAPRRVLASSPIGRRFVTLGGAPKHLEPSRVRHRHATSQRRRPGRHSPPPRSSGSGTDCRQALRTRRPAASSAPFRWRKSVAEFASVASVAESRNSTVPRRRRQRSDRSDAATAPAASRPLGPAAAAAAAAAAASGCRPPPPPAAARGPRGARHSCLQRSSLPEAAAPGPAPTDRE